MSTLTASEQQSVLDGLATYEYVDDRGLLDLERFCCTLSSCFAHDGNLRISPMPRDVFMLLIGLLDEVDSEFKQQRKIFYQPIKPWRAEYAQIYPEKHITYIHVSGLLLVWNDWIYAIGRDLMNIEPETSSPKYFYWARREWIFVYAFINGFHKAFTELLKSVDKKASVENGFSGFEALHRSSTGNADIESVIEQLKARSSAHTKAIEEIDSAVAAGFYLEAIVLEECLISNVLFNFLAAVGTDLNGPTLNRLIVEVNKATKKRDVETRKLLEGIDDWRKLRNTAIHGAVTQKIERYPSSDFCGEYAYGETVALGKALCAAVSSWYREKAVNFIPTEFDSTDDH